MANQGSLLDVLKKKMRSMKEDLEASQEAAQENHQKYQVEKRRREEVSFFVFHFFFCLPHSFYFESNCSIKHV